MAVTFVGAGTFAASATSGAAIAPGLPAGWAADDIAVLWYHRSSNTDLATPSGWTEILAANQNNTSAQRVEVFVRRLVGGDSAPSLPGPADTTVRGARIVAVRGVPTSGTAESWIVAASRSNNTTGPTVTFATITPGTDDCFLLALEAYEDDPTARTTPAGWSAPVIAGSTLGNDMSLVYMTRDWPTGATPTGAITYTASGGSFAGPNVGILLAFAPGAPVVLTQLVGASGGQAVGVASALARGRAVVGASAARGAAIGAVLATRGLVGRAAGTGTATGDLWPTRGLVGQASSRAGAVGDLSVSSVTIVDVTDARASGRAHASARLTATRPLVGRAAGQARATADALTLAGQVALTGALALGQATAAAAMRLARGLLGQATGATSSTSDLTVTAPAGGPVALAGVSTGRCVARAVLTLRPTVPPRRLATIVPVAVRRAAVAPVAVRTVTITTNTQRTVTLAPVAGRTATIAAAPGRRTTITEVTDGD
jgi:hypothetical protein